jgi:ribosomal protein L37AE/L43A
MSLTPLKNLTETEKHLKSTQPRCQDSCSRPVVEPQNIRDWQCSLCGRRISSDILQAEIPLCADCNRHYAALSDGRIKSCIKHWLRRDRPSDHLNNCRLTKLAS